MLLPRHQEPWLVRIIYNSPSLTSFLNLFNQILPRYNICYRIKTNVNRGPTFRFLNAIEYIRVGYFDETKKQRIKDHSNEVEGSNLLVYPAMTRKLLHVTTIERGLVNPYQKPQRRMMRLIEMFSVEGDCILDLFSGTGISSN